MSRAACNTRMTLTIFGFNNVEHQIVSEAGNPPFAQVSQSWMIDFVAWPSRGMIADLAISLVDSIIKRIAASKLFLAMNAAGTSTSASAAEYYAVHTRFS